MPSEFEQPEEELVSTPEVQPEERKDSWASKWKAASGRWAKETTISYLSNPAARKDFKVQFRGSRSGWLFGAYLVILGMTSLFEYWKISAGNFDTITAQNMLVDFYRTILVLLGIVISLVAPALAAGVIVAEKQRKSLDLVFSAPVRPRVYLIGKIIASYRYTWILLALSLPFTAMSVILGGASWGDVASAYALLSVHGLVFTSIGLLFSSLTEKTISSLVYTYGTVIAYTYATAGLGLATQALSGDKSFPELMNPITLVDALGSVTRIGWLPVPNILLAVGACLVVVRLCLATAGAALVPPRPRERASLRLGASTGLAGLVGVITFVGETGQHPVSGTWAGVALFCCSLCLAIFMPFLSCYGFDEEQRAKPNGAFSLRRTFTGTPAGALPFTLFTIGISAAAAWLGVVLWGGHSEVGTLGAFTVYTAGFWTFFWACGRYASSLLMGLKASRTIQFILFVAFIGAPLPLLAYLSSIRPSAGSGDFPWNIYPLAPLFQSPIVPAQVAAWGAGIGALGALLAWWSEGNLRRRLAKKGKDLSEIARAVGTMP